MRAPLVSLVFTCLMACTPEERLSPLSGPGTTPTTPQPIPTDTGVGGAPGVDAGTPVRSVFHRNPVGGPLGNLLADGDFELSAVPEGASGQYGFQVFSSAGNPSTFVIETGGRCLSGLRCANLKAGQVLFGRGTAAAKLSPMKASLWVKPLELSGDRPCRVLTAYALLCDDFGRILGQLSTGMTPNEQGWCEYTEAIPGQSSGVCLYIEVNKATWMDAATLLPSDPSAPAPARIQLPIAEDARARMSRIAHAIKFPPAPPVRPLPATIPQH